MRVDSPMISYHSLEGGKSDRVMSVDVHPDGADGAVTFATAGIGENDGGGRAAREPIGRSVRTRVAPLPRAGRGPTAGCHVYIPRS